jgi:ComF family protein
MGALSVLGSSQCELCRRWGARRVCAACEARFAPPRARCRRCGLPTGQALAQCGDCLRDPPPFGRAVVAVDYAFPWDGLVIDFKFNGRVELAGALADLLARRIDAEADAHARCDLVVPVPLARGRLAERGFNQAWELARRVARRLGLPAHAAALARALDTPHQAGLGRAERQRNLRNAFVPAREGLAGRRAALVDDVMTTGATAREAAAALLRGGAAAVDLWLFARTP